jgi:hypothetical protein
MDRATNGKWNLENLSLPTWSYKFFKELPLIYHADTPMQIIRTEVSVGEWKVVWGLI